jgi:hypothetical protein
MPDGHGCYRHRPCAPACCCKPATTTAASCAPRHALGRAPPLALGRLPLRRDYNSVAAGRRGSRRRRTQGDGVTSWYGTLRKARQGVQSRGRCDSWIKPAWLGGSSPPRHKEKPTYKPSAPSPSISHALKKYPLCYLLFFFFFDKERFIT